MKSLMYHHICGRDSRPVVDNRNPDVRTTRRLLNVLRGTYSTLVAGGHRLTVAERTDIHRRTVTNASLRMRGVKTRGGWRMEQCSTADEMFLLQLFVVTS